MTNRDRAVSQTKQLRRIRNKLQPTVPAKTALPVYRSFPKGMRRVTPLIPTLTLPPVEIPPTTTALPLRAVQSAVKS